MTSTYSRSEEHGPSYCRKPRWLFRSFLDRKYDPVSSLTSPSLTNLRQRNRFSADLESLRDKGPHYFSNRVHQPLVRNTPQSTPHQLQSRTTQCSCWQSNRPSRQRSDLHKSNSRLSIS